MPENKETIMVLLSNEQTPPDAARKLWPNTRIGMKQNFRVPGKGKGVMNVFFPAVKEMRRADGGWKINYGWLKENLTFEDHEGNTLKGVHVGE